VASTFDYAPTASPTSPTSRPCDPGGETVTEAGKAQLPGGEPDGVGLGADQVRGGDASAIWTGSAGRRLRRPRPGVRSRPERGKRLSSVLEPRGQDGLGCRCGPRSAAPHGTVTTPTRRRTATSAAVGHPAWAPSDRRPSRTAATIQVGSSPNRSPTSWGFSSLSISASVRRGIPGEQYGHRCQPDCVAGQRPHQPGYQCPDLAEVIRQRRFAGRVAFTGSQGLGLRRDGAEPQGAWPVRRHAGRRPDPGLRRPRLGPGRSPHGRSSRSGKWSGPARSTVP
jgi:hypothetical protein